MNSHWKYEIVLADTPLNIHEFAAKLKEAQDHYEPLGIRGKNYESRVVLISWLRETRRWHLQFTPAQFSLEWTTIVLESKKFVVVRAINIYFGIYFTVLF